MSIRVTTCAARRCALPRYRESQWCTRHRNHASRNGDGNAYAVQPSVLKQYSRTVNEFLGRYDATPTLTLAYTLATRLLAYRVPAGASRSEREVMLAMHRLTQGGVTPERLLHRVVSFYLWLDCEGHRLNFAPRAERFALARMVLRMVKAQKPGHARTLLMDSVGEAVTEALGSFGIAAAHRIQQDEERRRSAIRQSMTYPT